MKEATGEVSMTVVTLVAIALIGGVLAFVWPSVKTKVNSLWGNSECPAGQVKSGGTCVTR